jgi:hypothetical protein
MTKLGVGVEERDATGTHTQEISSKGKFIWMCIAFRG